MLLCHHLLQRYWKEYRWTMSLLILINIMVILIILKKLFETTNTLYGSVRMRDFIFLYIYINIYCSFLFKLAFFRISFQIIVLFYWDNPMQKQIATPRLDATGPSAAVVVFPQPHHSSRSCGTICPSK